MTRAGLGTEQVVPNPGEIALRLYRMEQDLVIAERACARLRDNLERITDEEDRRRAIDESRAPGAMA